MEWEREQCSASNVAVRAELTTYHQRHTADKAFIVDKMYWYTVFVLLPRLTKDPFAQLLLQVIRTRVWAHLDLAKHGIQIAYMP